MRHPHIAIIFLIPLFTTAFSQEYSGTVSSAEKNEFIPYVNIGMVGRNYGTVSDEKGNFSITLRETHDFDTLRFSAVGYESRNFIVKDFRTSYSENASTIVLHPKVTMLQEVVVKSNSGQPFVLGNLPKSKFVNAGLLNNRLGNEIGSLFKIQKTTVFIDSIQLNIAKCTYDSVFLRLNIYKANGLHMENILPEPVYITVTRKEARDNPIVNVSRYGIVVQTDFFVSVELVKNLGENGFFFYASLESDQYPALSRITSQGNWNYIYHKSKTSGISILAFVH